MTKYFGSFCDIRNVKVANADAKYKNTRLAPVGDEGFKV